MNIQPHPDTPEFARHISTFRNAVTAHMLLTEAYENTVTASGQIGGGEKIVVVAGPSGVGKSTLARTLYKNLKLSYKEEIDSDRSCVPVAGMSAVPASNRSFSWKDFYIRLLFKSGSPLVNKSFLASPQMSFLGGGTHDTPADRMVADKLRRCAEETFRQRATRWLIIDEAHHILLAKDSEVNVIQFEALKSLAQQTRVTIVLVGTYKLLDIRDQSDQLVRRSSMIHFPRYDLCNKRHQVEFARALSYFEERMILPQPSRLVADADNFMFKSIGCVGILKDWLTETYAKALAEKQPYIDYEYAKKFALKNNALRTLARAAVAGESRLEDISDAELFNALTHARGENHGADAVTSDRSPESDAPQNSDVAKHSAGIDKPLAQGRYRVGQRLPHRDPVGKDRDAA